MEQIKKYCKCGCGEIITSKYGAKYVNHHFGKSKEGKKVYSLAFKGKTWDEIRGKEKSDLRKKELSLERKGKKAQEFLSKQGLKNIQDAQRIRLKGKTWKEQFGNKYQSVCDKKIISKEQIINETKKIFEEHKILTKTQFYKILKERCCDPEVIRYKFGGSDNLAKETNIKFNKVDPSVWDHGGHIGYNEKEILDHIENLLNIKLERQYRVKKFYVDGYDKENNIVYEVDEKCHKYTKIRDIIRQEEIIKILNCKFIRINEKYYLAKIKNNLKSFDEVMSYGIIKY
jgi:very-short-patch-repair endonuclease